MIIGVDPGNHRVKLCGPHGVLDFSSALGEWRKRNLKQSFGYDDMEWEIDGRKGFGGTLAEYESDWSTTRKGDSKAHEDAKIRVLLALHRYGEIGTHKLIVCQPIGGYTQEEKTKIKAMLFGQHQVSVNGVVRRFGIESVEVCPEGGVAGLVKPQECKRRIIEIGSGTVNFATVIGRMEDGKMKVRYIDRDSWSIPIGTENTKNTREEMARGIVNEALGRWNPHDAVEVAGCVAEEMHPVIVKAFVNAKVLSPQVTFRREQEPHLPACAYANAVGAYELGKMIYG